MNYIKTITPLLLLTALACGENHPAPAEPRGRIAQQQVYLEIERRGFPLLVYHDNSIFYADNVDINSDGKKDLFYSIMGTSFSEKNLIPILVNFSDYYQNCDIDSIEKVDSLRRFKLNEVSQELPVYLGQSVYQNLSEGFLRLANDENLFNDEQYQDFKENLKFILEN